MSSFLVCHSVNFVSFTIYALFSFFLLWENIKIFSTYYGGVHRVNKKKWLIHEYISLRYLFLAHLLYHNIYGPFRYGVGYKRPLLHWRNRLYIYNLCQARESMRTTMMMIIFRYNFVFAHFSNLRNIFIFGIWH